MGAKWKISSISKANFSKYREIFEQLSNSKRAFRIFEKIASLWISTSIKMKITTNFYVQI